MKLCGGSNGEVNGLVLDFTQLFKSPSQNGNLTSYQFSRNRLKCVETYEEQSVTHSSLHKDSLNIYSRSELSSTMQTL
jgi:hypothetical protein